MSLVYAKIIGKQAFMISDTKLSEIDNILLREEIKRNGIIKCKIISLDLVVGFAGELARWKQLLASITENSSVDKLISTAININNLYHDDASFLFLSHDYTGYRLIKVEDYKTEVVSEAFIGDLSAVNQFKHYKSNNVIELERLFADSGVVFISQQPCEPSVETDDFDFSSKAMYLTINNGHFETIGGFPVCISFTDDRFKFNNYFVFCGNTIPSDNECLCSENGSFSFHCLPIADNVIAVYYVPGHFGIIYNSDNDLYMSPNIYQPNQF